MSGPKIIDIAATRQRERLRLGMLCNQILSALERFERISRACPGLHDLQMPNLIREHLAELQRKAETSEKVVEIMAMVESAKSQIFFVHAEKKRIETSAREWRATEAGNVKAIDQIIGRLRKEAGDDAGLGNELDRAETETDFLTRAKIVEKVSLVLEKRKADLANSEECAAIQKLTTEWEKLVAAGSFETCELPVLPQARWRIELERIRDELSGHPEISSEIERVEKEANPEKRQMLLDSLRYDAAASLLEERERNERLELQAQWRDAYTSLGLLTADREKDLDAALFLSASEFYTYRESTDQAIEAALESAAAAYARDAILESLEMLGYEVREGMATAWVENGKIVLSKLSDSTFGLELSRLPSGKESQIKTRVVRTKGAAAATTDEKQRDREQEESWCADREKMEGLLEKKGVELTIKTARQPGEAQVEAIEEAAETRHRSISGERSL